MANIPLPGPAHLAPPQSPPSVSTEAVPEPPGPPVGLVTDLPVPLPVAPPIIPPPVSSYPDPDAFDLIHSFKRLAPVLSRNRRTNPTTPQAGGHHVAPGHEAEGHELQDLNAGQAQVTNVPGPVSWSFGSLVRAAWEKLRGWMCL
ncbi:unnamed protein product [Peniophora sp. CBMAI 1063]|nr:unnamed protein product [Peniophora sp. CBMAI 1063]